MAGRKRCSSCHRRRRPAQVEPVILCEECAGGSAAGSPSPQALSPGRPQQSVLNLGIAEARSKGDKGLDLRTFWLPGYYAEFYDENLAHRTMKVEEVYSDHLTVIDNMDKNEYGHYIRHTVWRDRSTTPSGQRMRSRLLGRYDRRKNCSYAFTATEASRLLWPADPLLPNEQQRRIQASYDAAQERVRLGIRSRSSGHSSEESYNNPPDAEGTEAGA